MKHIELPSSTGMIMYTKYEESIMNGTDYIYIANEDGSIYVYDVKSESFIMNYTNEKETCISFDISPTPSLDKIVSGGASTNIYSNKLDYQNVFLIFIIIFI